MLRREKVTSKVVGIIMPICKLRIQFLNFPLSLSLPKENITSSTNFSAFLPSCCRSFHILNSSIHCLPLEDEISDILTENSNPYSVKDTCIGEHEVVNLVRTMNYHESDQNITQICLNQTASTNKSQDMKMMMLICRKPLDWLSPDSINQSPYFLRSVGSKILGRMEGKVGSF